LPEAGGGFFGGGEGGVVEEFVEDGLFVGGFFVGRGLGAGVVNLGYLVFDVLDGGG
jgi:hypothetical protein